MDILLYASIFLKNCYMANWEIGLGGRINKSYPITPRIFAPIKRLPMLPKANDVFSKKI